MHISTSPARKSFKRPIALATVLAGVAAAGAVLTLGAGPALAAEFATQPDAQIAVFMVPVTMLILVMMFEVARFVWRNRIPSSAPARRRQTDWSAKPGLR